MRSLRSFVLFSTGEPEERRPLYTRMYVSLPRCGSEAILKARAENGSDSSGWREDGVSPSLSVPATAPTSSGLGR